MDFIETIKNRVRNNKKTIVLPEASDIRVLKAASIIKKEDFATILLIGNQEEIQWYYNY